jgi:dihydroorotate dehydrogenase electron transfer subunit
MNDSTGTCRVMGRVTSVQALGGMTRLSVRVPGWAGAKPGQFALLHSEASDCFLGRAFSICESSSDVASFLVAPIGKGTRELCGLAEDGGVWVLGPLGNGFDMQELMAGTARVLLVGGGVGIAPFPLLIEELAKRPRPAPRSAGDGGPEVLVLAGFRDQAQAEGGEVLAEAVANATRAGFSCLHETVFEDGSSGPAERVTELLSRHLEPGDRLAVCGSEAMSKAVWQICSSVADVRVWFSLEANMACGVGSCHGCVVRLGDGSYARVCREGPVFAGEAVFGG